VDAFVRRRRNNNRRLQQFALDHDHGCKWIALVADRRLRVQWDDSDRQLDRQRYGQQYGRDSNGYIDFDIEAYADSDSFVDADYQAHCDTDCRFDSNSHLDFDAEWLDLLRIAEWQRLCRRELERAVADNSEGGQHSKGETDCDHIGRQLRRAGRNCELGDASLADHFTSRQWSGCSASGLRPDGQQLGAERI